MDNLAAVESIFFAALEKHAPEERAAFLDQACASDAQLRSHVERLLKAQPKLGSFLQEPAASLASPVEGQPIAEGPGTMVGLYKLMEQIGEGGMGLVFEAEQLHPLRRKVALKLIKPGMDTRNVIARFEAERQALALMDHPNIAKVLDAGATESGRPYFVMELVMGMPITDYCDQQQLPPRARLVLFASVCQAIQHAHSKGVVHRDLKPSNVLVTLLDGAAVVKVIDFGVAKALTQQLTDKTIYTHVNQIIGTPAYMSPEQAAVTSVDIDTRSDVYALGVLLYELLTGTTPFERERLSKAAFDEIRRIIREEEPPRPSTRLGTLRTRATQTPDSAKRKSEQGRLAALCKGDLDWIVMKALEKDRTRRYDTPSALAADVRRFLAEEPVEARPPSAGYRFRKFARRNKVGLAIGGLILFFIVLLGSGAGWVVRDRSFREAEALQERRTREAEAIRDRKAREAETARAVGAALEEAETLQRARKIPEALAKVKQAAAILAGGTGTPPLEQRVQERLADLKFVTELENIRADLVADLILLDRTFAYDYAQADRKYAKAFRGFGIDVEVLAPEEAAGRIRQRTVPVELATALDLWASAVRKIKPVDDSRWKHLLAVARATDADPFRHKVWTALEKANGNALKDLVNGIKVEELPADTLLAFVEAVGSLGDAEKLLRQAQRAHPSDFWINYNLAHRLFYSQPPQNEEAIRFFTAALAIRPDDAVAHTMLGNVLVRTGKLDEAIAVHRKAVALNGDFPVFHLNLGNALAQKGLLDDAEIAFQKAVSLRPDFVLALTALARLQKDKPRQETAPKQLGAGAAAGKETQNEPLAWQDQETDLTLMALRKAIQANPTNPDLHFNLARELAAKGRINAAITALQQAVELQPHNLDRQLDLGGWLKAAGRLEDAIARYRAAIANGQPKQNPEGYAKAHAELAWLLANASDPLVRDPREAVEVAKKAIALKPKDGNYWNALGIAQYRLRNYQDALDALQNAIVLNPNGTQDANSKSMGKVPGQAGNSIGFFTIAMSHWRLGAKADALKWYGKGIQWMEKNVPTVETFVQLHAEATELLEIVDPKDRQLGPSLAAYNRGKELTEMRQFEKAIVELRESLRLRPETAAIHGALADALNYNFQTDEAIAEYRNLLRLQPTNSWAHANIGNMLRRKGELVEAIVECRIAINLATNNASAKAHAHAQLGAALRANGKLDDAIKEGREGTKLSPKGALHHFELGRSLETKGLLDDAIAEYREARRLDPKLAYIHNALGSALAKSGQLKKAIAELKWVTDDHPRDPAGHVNLGKAYAKMGQVDKCIAAYQAALRVTPGGKHDPHVAWVLANSPDPNQRDPKKAVIQVKRVIDMDVTVGENWTTLGVACYRNGEWQDALAALGESMKFRGGGDSTDYFFLAMVHWQLREKDQARTWYDKGVAWLTQYQPMDAELQGLRGEAAELLEINAPTIKGKDQPANKK